MPKWLAEAGGPADFDLALFRALVLSAREIEVSQSVRVPNVSNKRQRTPRSGDSVDMVWRKRGCGRDDAFVDLDLVRRVVVRDKWTGQGSSDLSIVCERRIASPTLSEWGVKKASRVRGEVT